MFLNFVLICVTLILCLICLKLTFESLFTNYVFEFLICFVRVIIAWPGDRPIFQEEDEDMADVVNFRASLYVMRLNQTFELKVMTIRISRELPLFNFERINILCHRIEHPSEMLSPFEFLESFRCSISSV